MIKSKDITRLPVMCFDFLVNVQSTLFPLVLDMHIPADILMWV
jgi:hypothetical protein